MRSLSYYDEEAIIKGWLWSNLRNKPGGRPADWYRIYTEGMYRVTKCRLCGEAISLAAPYSKHTARQTLRRYDHRAAHIKSIETYTFGDIAPDGTDVTNFNTRRTPTV